MRGQTAPGDVKRGKKPILSLFVPILALAIGIAVTAGLGELTDGFDIGGPVFTTVQIVVILGSVIGVAALCYAFDFKRIGLARPRPKAIGLSILFVSLFVLELLFGFLSFLMGSGPIVYLVLAALAIIFTLFVAFKFLAEKKQVYEEQFLTPGDSPDQPWHNQAPPIQNDSDPSQPQ